MAALILASIAGAVHAHLTIDRTVKRYETDGVVVSGHIRTWGNNFVGLTRKCYFWIRLEDGQDIECGRRFCEYCPGTNELCNRLTKGSLVRVVYWNNVTTDNSIFGSGEPYEDFGDITSIRPRDG